jgi:hypothetical protein
MAKRIYRIIFVNHDTICELYAESFFESENYGFIEVESILFGESSSIVVDPSEERLKNEFRDVKRTFIPVHAVIRIDEVMKQGVGKLTDIKGETVKVSPFPQFPTVRPDKK